MKFSAEVWIAGVVFLVLGYRIVTDDKETASEQSKSENNVDFLGHDDYFADMAGGMNVFSKGSNIQNEDFVIKRFSKPNLGNLTRKVRLTESSDSI
jgi:putative Ca2+/H+ antiporter (TMEM165/GDT1 family)